MLQELKIAGYTKSEIDRKFEIVKGKLMQEKCDDEEGLSVGEECDRVYGAKTEYSEVTMTHKIVRDVLSSCLGERKVSLPMCVPGRKLISYCYTKAKMQEKVRVFIGED